MKSFLILLLLLLTISCKSSNKVISDKVEYFDDICSVWLIERDSTGEVKLILVNYIGCPGNPDSKRK